MGGVFSVGAVLILGGLALVACHYAGRGVGALKRRLGKKRGK